MGASSSSFTDEHNRSSVIWAKVPRAAALTPCDLSNRAPLRNGTNRRSEVDPRAPRDSASCGGKAKAWLAARYGGAFRQDPAVPSSRLQHSCGLSSDSGLGETVRGESGLLRGSSVRIQALRRPPRLSPLTGEHLSEADGIPGILHRTRAHPCMRRNILCHQRPGAAVEAGCGSWAAEAWRRRRKRSK